MTIRKLHIVGKDVRIRQVGYLFVVFIRSTNLEDVPAVNLKVAMILAVLH